MSTERRRYFLLLLVLTACRPHATSADAGASDASSPPTAEKAAAPGASALPSSRQEDALITVTMAWNDALARRDAPALRRVYGERVRLYEEQLDRETAIARKAAAFKRAPDYTQSIRSLKVDRSHPERPTVEFLKTWRTGGKESSTRGVLVLGTEGGDHHAVVLEESDVATDAKRLAALRDEGCLGLVHAAVFSTPSGRSYHGKDAFTMIACEPPECDGFQVAAGRIGGDPPSFQREALFEVDPKKGAVTHASVAEPADPAILARLKTACAAEYPAK
jgi:hypothetical protein